MEQLAPLVIDVEPIDLDALTEQTPTYLPAIPESFVLTTCRCGNVTDRGHNGHTCREVLDIRARVEFGQLAPWQRFIARLRGLEPVGWRS